MAKSNTSADRTGLVIWAVVLLLLGIAGVLWYLEPSWLPELRDEVNFGGYTEEAVDQQWFPWAALALGIIITVISLAVLLRRLGHSSVGDLRLPGSSSQGRLTLDPKAVSKAAAEDLGDTMGVRSVKSTTRVIEKHKVVELDVEADPIVSLEMLKSSIAETRAAMLRAMGGRAEVRVLVDVAEESSRGSAPRVM